MPTTMTGAGSRVRAKHRVPVRDRDLSHSLAWLSIGLGLAQIVAPHALGEIIGIRGHRALLRGLGFRELANGIAILSQPDQATWLWARLAGDALDIALLTRALASEDHARDRVAAALAAVIGVTVLDAAAGRKLAAAGETTGFVRRRDANRATKTVTINRPLAEVYRFWRNFENLPRFMTHLDAVGIIDERRSHWRVKGPVGRSIEWDSEITDDRENERIAWRSLGGADVENAGSVEFREAPGGRGTEVRVNLEYRTPGGSAGALVASLFGEEPSQKLRSDLRTLKALMETGEIPRAESSFGVFKHAARPSRQVE